MSNDTKKQKSKPWLINPSNVEANKKQKEQSESIEVVGRHKNDGQKDHKGAR